MTLKLLQDTVRLHLKARGASPEAVETFLSRWEASLQADSGAPLPCPDCYVAGLVVRLRRVPSPAGVGILQCPTCSGTLEFPDFQPVANTQGIWPTRD